MNCRAHTYIHSISYSFKLQFHVDPEDRRYPNNYRNRQTPSASTSTETLLNPESRLPAADAQTQADESTHSTAASSSSVAASLRLPDHPSTPVPGPSRRLQRERPFSVAPDPMWNSSREIRPQESLAATHAPPPPYVLPPTYAEVVPPRQIESVVQVVHSAGPSPVEIIDIEPSTLQSSILDVRDVSISSDNIRRVPVTEEEANNAPSYSFGPSWTFASTMQAQSPTPSEDLAADDTDSDDENPYIGSEVTTSADDAEHDDPSHPLDLSTFLLAEEAENSTTSDDEMGDVVVGSSGDENPDADSQLSEKARGKKRMRDEDYPSDDKDDSETLEMLLGEGSSGGSSSSSSSTSSDRDGQPDRKRMKTDAETEGRINTDQSVVDERLSMIARLGFIRKSSWSRAKQMKDIKKLYRRALLLA
jgi:hypothetical protein